MLVSNNGPWELDNFEAMLSRNANIEFAGALLRPNGEAFANNAGDGRTSEGRPDAAKEPVASGKLFDFYWSGSR
jgi:hypothetical protein